MTGAKKVTATFMPSTYLLTVRTAGTGRGAVSGAGISCAAGSTEGCSAAVANGAMVTLVGSPSPCSFFGGWSGGCYGTGDCTITMTAAKTVTATFTAECVVVQ